MYLLKITSKKSHLHFSNTLYNTWNVTDQLRLLIAHKTKYNPFIRTKGRNNDITREDYEDLEFNMSTKAKLSTWKITFLFVSCLHHVVTARTIGTSSRNVMSCKIFPFHSVVHCKTIHLFWKKAPHPNEPELSVSNWSPSLVT